MNITKIVGNFITLLLSTLLTFMFIREGFVSISALVILISVFTLWVINSEKQYALRFLYPGLITFLLFMLIPMLFTIYISFTNLGTGHFMSYNEAMKVISQEKYADSESNSKFFLNKNSEGGYLISFEVGDKFYNAIFAKSDANTKVKAFQVSGHPQEFTYMSSGEVFGERELLKSISFDVDGHELSYLQSDLLASLKQRYNILNEETIKDNQTEQIYTLNREKGFYACGEETLAPGFYITTGFKNYIKLLTDDRIKQNFLKILSWTLIWAFGTVALTFTVGLICALLLNPKNFACKRIYSSLLIIPYSIPFFISVLIFKGMLNKDFGIINEFVAYFGIARIDWLTDSFNAKISALAVNLWLGFPYMFLLITGILKSIPDSVYEAAKMDGAGRIVTLRKITLPMIFSAIVPLLVGSFAFNLNNFVGIYLLTGGGPAMINSTTPAGDTDLLISYTYKLAFEGGQGQDFGLAASIAMFIFIIVTILTLINFKMSGMLKKDNA